MLNIADEISASEMIFNIIPKLKATENLVNNTLRDMIAEVDNADDRSRYQGLKQEFELEIMMINMNLDHLLKRYAHEMRAVAESGCDSADATLTLDQYERSAIDSARKLYERARSIQAGK